MRFVPVAVSFVACALAAGCTQKADPEPGPVASTPSAQNGAGFNNGGVMGPKVPAGAAAAASTDELIRRGKEIFRFDTFGDEQFWSGRLKLHQALEGSANGGVGNGVSPKTALAVGLKVDSDALPHEVVAALRTGQVNLDDPATTVALLRLNAVVGVRITSNPDNSIRTLGVTCAICHSTVDDSLAPGVGKRLDGWPNRDLNIGAIIDLSPDLVSVANILGTDVGTVHKVLQSWGPGKYDAELTLDGKAFQPDGRSAATLIPAAYGLAGTNLHTYTGWGSIPYWNGFVAVLQMHGVGNFSDSRLNDAAKFPLAAKNGFARVKVDPAMDQVTSKLPALQAYELSLQAPPPPAGSFDPVAAKRGEALFEGAAGCANCHMGPAHTDTGWNMHSAQELGIDDFQASRSPENAYRTTPLNGLWAHVKGGFYHDGRFATLLQVINHYDSTFALGLSEPQKLDLREYLKSLGPAEVAQPMDESP